MANNIDITPGTGKTVKTTDNAGIHTPHHNVDAIANGASVDIGAVADAAVVTDTTGSLSGKLRGLIKWAFERMPAALGQTTMSASLPVVIASNQTGVPIGAGASSIGGVMDNGPYNTPSQIDVTSADASGTVDLTERPVSGQRIIVDDLIVSVGTSCEVTVLEETSLTVLGRFLMLANTPLVIPYMKGGFRAVSSDLRLRIKTSTASTLRVAGTYHSEA